MLEIAQLRQLAAHYRSIAGSCNSVDKHVLLKIAQDFDDAAGRVAESRSQLP